ncbi:MAG: polysaccharide biosynthesis tyrosine autokinase, partial [Opitutaceae bacterium]|nr:polysaccharide biosynthesis tyrosine autokinase [Verrucomicrobiales bacterium]
WRVIRVRKAVILVVFLLVAITTTIVTFMLPPTYSSMARIQVEKNQADTAGLDGRQAYSGFDPFFLQTEFNVIRSAAVLDQAITNLNLLEVWGKKYSSDGSQLKPNDCREILKRLISVQEVRNTSLIDIGAYSDDMQEAADIANAVANAYYNFRQESKTKGTKGGIDAFRKRLKAKEDTISAKQIALNEMRQSNQIPDMADQSTFSAVRLLHTETLAKTELDRLEAESNLRRFDTIYSQLVTNSPAELPFSLAYLFPEPGLTTLLDTLALAQQTLTRKKQDFTEAHPEYKNAQAILTKVEEQVSDKVKGVLMGLAIQVNGYKRQVDLLTEKVDALRKEDIVLMAKYSPYFVAKRDLEKENEIKYALITRLEQESVEADLPTSSMVKVIEPATTNLKPYRPRKALNIGLGVVVGLFMGVALAFFIEYLDTSVKTIDDVERALQAPVLAVIPQNVGSLLDEGPESPHAEAYRVLRTNILFSRKDDTLNTVTVISGGAGEGKSTTLFNLATVFAQNGSRVLVVDSDLRRPSIHKVLRLSNTIGLTNYLLRQNTLEQVIQTTGLTNLDFLPSGKLPSSSMGILSSPQMREMIQELKRRYDFVFFDSPPIMGVSDAQVLASEVDMVLQVIQYRRYPQQMTIRTKQMIQKAGGNLMGLVLNNINMSQDENYYYYSGYYQDYYSKRDDDDDDVPAKKTPKGTDKAALKGKY